MAEFRNDGNGTWRTKTLFVEMLGPKQIEKHKPPYTLHEVDIERQGIKYQSLYKLFMECADAYEFCTKYLGGPAHLKSLKKSKWFYDGHRAHRGWDAWEEDMKLRDNSLAKRALILATKEGKTQAASKLYDNTKEVESKRGRFVKDEAIKQAAKKVEDDDFLKDAASRLNVYDLRA